MDQSLQNEFELHFKNFKIKEVLEIEENLSTETKIWEKVWSDFVIKIVPIVQSQLKMKESLEMLNPTYVFKKVNFMDFSTQTLNHNFNDFRLDLVLKYITNYHDTNVQFDDDDENSILGDKLSIKVYVDDGDYIPNVERSGVSVDDPVVFWTKNMSPFKLIKSCLLKIDKWGLNWETDPHVIELILTNLIYDCPVKSENYQKVIERFFRPLFKYISSKIQDMAKNTIDLKNINYETEEYLNNLYENGPEVKFDFMKIMAEKDNFSHNVKLKFS